MPIVDLLILVLATWYTAHVVTKSRGMFGVFERARARVPHGGLLDCIVCFSPYAAGLNLLLMHTSLVVVVYALAAAGGALLLAVYVGADHAY